MDRFLQHNFRNGRLITQEWIERKRIKVSQQLKKGFLMALQAKLDFPLIVSLNNILLIAYYLSRVVPCAKSSSANVLHSAMPLTFGFKVVALRGYGAAPSCPAWNS